MSSNQLLIARNVRPKVTLTLLTCYFIKRLNDLKTIANYIDINVLLILR